MQMQIKKILAKSPVIPVLELSDLGAAPPLAQALAAGGLQVVELTLRTSCALDAIAIMKKAAPSLIVGMGTVRTAEDIKASIAAGADFLVSPGAGPSLISALADAAVPALPGLATASEAMVAFDSGFTEMKFFPAEPAGGISYLKSLAGPFPDITFCPTGGITAEDAPKYLALPNVLCVGGSWIATRGMIADQDWRAIEANANRASNMKSA